MRKYVYLIAVIIWLLVYVNFFTHVVKEDEALTKEIQREVDIGYKKIDLEAIAPFEFDFVRIFPPYTTRSDIEKEMKIEVRGDLGTIEVSDIAYLLVFAKDDYAYRIAFVENDGHTFKMEDKMLLVELE